MTTSLEDSEIINIKASNEDELVKNSEIEERKIKLLDLKVAELKAELEKRQLDKNGVKSVLIERLRNALVEVGEDPEVFIFNSQSECVNSKTQSKKKSLPDAETNGGIDNKEDKDTDMKEDTADEVTEEDASVEAKKTSVCSEDKNINEVTLQISIDEEDAQLNEDETMEVAKASDTENDAKMEETNASNCAASAEKTAESVPEETSGVENIPSKAPKTATEDSKEKKAVKTAAVTKASEVTAVVSPKVLKAIGKNDKLKNASVLGKSLWVAGLPNTTRAADLKTVFGKHGRVLSVRIVKSTKQTPAKCYGFVTMATSKDGTKAIQNLHRTELNGRTISVERTQSDPSALLKKFESKQVVLNTKKIVAKKDATKASESAKSTSDAKVTTKVETKATEAKPDEPAKGKEEKSKASEKSKSKERDQKSRDRKDREPARKPADKKTTVHRSRPVASNDRSRFGTARRTFGSRPLAGRSRFGSSFRPRQEISIYERMREERIRRDRIRDRERREAEKRRIEELNHHKFIERKQREEAYRLEREKEKLRIERELLERERAEMLKMEREKQRLERERLEREREELRRVAELRRVVASPPAERSYARASRETDVFLDYRKKATPRYEERSSFHTEKVRLEPATSSRYDFPARERASFGRHEFERRPAERYVPAKTVASTSRAEYTDRDSRREVTIRTRDERPVFERSEFRDRDSRRSFPPRERASTSRRETSRDDWKHDRRVHDRVATARDSNIQRRSNYY